MKIEDIKVVDTITLYSREWSPIGIIGILNSNIGFECCKVIINDKNYWISLMEKEDIEDKQTNISDKEKEEIFKFISEFGGKEKILKMTQEMYDDRIENNRFSLRDVFIKANKKR